MYETTLNKCKDTFFSKPSRCLNSNELQCAHFWAMSNVATANLNISQCVPMCILTHALHCHLRCLLCCGKACCHHLSAIASRPAKSHFVKHTPPLTPLLNLFMHTVAQHICINVHLGLTSEALRALKASLVVAEEAEALFPRLLKQEPSFLQPWVLLPNSAVNHRRLSNVLPLPLAPPLSFWRSTPLLPSSFWQLVPVQLPLHALPPALVFSFSPPQLPWQSLPPRLFFSSPPRLPLKPLTPMFFSLSFPPL